jgi:hypothetical protein
MGKDEYGLQTQVGRDGAVFPTTRMTDIDGEPKAQSKLFSSRGWFLSRAFEIALRGFLLRLFWRLHP